MFINLRIMVRNILANPGKSCLQICQHFSLPHFWWRTVHQPDCMLFLKVVFSAVDSTKLPGLEVMTTVFRVMVRFIHGSLLMLKIQATSGLATKSALEILVLYQFCRKVTMLDEVGPTAWRIFCRFWLIKECWGLSS